jgi:tetratricopeptide (TPR) repeat protein
MMAELDDELHERIVALSSEGDELAAQSLFEDAVAKYNEAWALIPEPRTAWKASTWVLAALGDAFFLGGHIQAARKPLEYAMHCPDGIGNPFLHLRLGQVLFEERELDCAADELMRAYMGAGEEIFASEDPKYRAFLATRANLNEAEL